MKQTKFIDKIGCEIEGGWNYGREDLHEDLGIKMGGFKTSACCGEAISKPIGDLDEMIEWIKTNYKGLETQHMCGLHFHFSFNDISHYVALMNKKFHAHFINSMIKFGEGYPINNPHFWDRLENKNKFCKNEFRPEEQIFLKKKIPNDHGRYTQLHYAFGLHKTIESRLLPTFVTVECAIAGLLAHVDCFESYLNENPPKPFDLNQELTIEEESHSDETIDLNGSIPPLRRLARVKPFNIFIAKGMVPETKYGIKEFLKLDKKSANVFSKRPVSKNQKNASGRDIALGKAIWDGKEQIWKSQAIEEDIEYPAPYPSPKKEASAYDLAIKGKLV